MFELCLDSVSQIPPTGTSQMSRAPACPCHVRVGGPFVLPTGQLVPVVVNTSGGGACVLLDAGG